MSQNYSTSKNLPVYDVNGSDFLLWDMSDYARMCDAGDKVAFLSGCNRHGDVFNFFAPTVARDGATVHGLVGNINDSLHQPGLLTFNAKDFGFAPFIMKFDEINEKIRPAEPLNTDHLFGSTWAKKMLVSH